MTEQTLMSIDTKGGSYLSMIGVISFQPTCLVLSKLYK